MHPGSFQNHKSIDSFWKSDKGGGEECGGVAKLKGINNRAEMDKVMEKGNEISCDI